MSGARLLGVALFLGLASPVNAGSMRSEGENDLNISLRMDYGDRFWDRDGERVNTGCAGSTTVGASYERGLSYYHTAFVKSGVKHDPCGPGSTRMDDIEVGIRGRVDPLDDRYVWETSLYLPASRWTGGSVDQESGSFGANAGIHVNNVPDPYASFFDPVTHQAGKFGYGAGVRFWSAHVPGQAWAYLAYSKGFGDANWQRDLGAWWIYTRLDGKHSLGREHSTHFDRSIDIHDRYWLVAWSAYLSRQIKPWQVLTLGLRWDLAGRNISDGSAIAVYYSWNWRD